MKTVVFNQKGNIILTLVEGCSAHQLLKFRTVVVEGLKSLKIKATSVEADQQWSKFKVHGISTEEFSGEDGMTKLKDEIEKHNPSIKLTQAPRWLTSAAARVGKKFSSIVLAVQGSAEAKAVKKGVYVLCQRRTSAEFVSTRPTDQCGQCLKFGHHWKLCTSQARCKICAGAHLSKDHHCKKCDKRGAPCGHGQLKCHNCGEGHMATNPQCSFYVKNRGPKKTVTPTQEEAPMDTTA